MNEDKDRDFKEPLQTAMFHYIEMLVRGLDLEFLSLLSFFTFSKNEFAGIITAERLL